VLHGKKIALKSDGEGAGKYDPASLTVYGPDGAEVTLNPAPKRAKDPPQAPGTGIRKVTVANNGRAITVETVEDDPTPRIEVIIIRVSGKFADQSPFVDYYRLVIMHGKKGQEGQVQKLLENVAYVLPNMHQADEDETLAINYARGPFATELVSQLPPDEDTDWPAELLCLADPGTNFQALMHGSLLFVVAYSQGGMDIWELDGEEPAARDADPQGPSDSCQNGSRNITGNGPGTETYYGAGASCDEQVYVTDQTGAAQRIDASTGQSTPLPEGQDKYYLSCGDNDDEPTERKVFASRPGSGGDDSIPEVSEEQGDDDDDQESCGPSCQQGAGSVWTELADLHDAPNSHIRQVVANPDLTMIAYMRLDATSSHIWVADFDPETNIVSNKRQLTTVSGNSNPTWSPDGTRIAFVSDRSGVNDIWVVNADGTGEMNMTNTPDVPEWVPSWEMR
jgi:hypothetical protein